MRDAGYRTQEEIAAWKARDPLVLLEKALVASDATVKAALEKVDAEVKAMVEEAAEFALASPLPAPGTVMDHVYSEK
jgi:acetoin:2,6-dichlorophenolindophenol oxidoreductase subunit alpha